MYKSRFHFRRFRVFMLLLAILVPILIFSTITTFEFEGEFEGIYLFKDREKLAFSLQNDIYVGDEQKLLCGLDFGPLYAFVLGEEYRAPSPPFLRHQWSNKSGRGYVLNYFPDGTKLLTCFGRFRDSDGSTPKGLFVGGGLPPSKKGAAEVTMNETGMAYFDGKSWNHIWCSVNESIIAAGTPDAVLPPSKWTFVDSRVVKKSEKKVVLRSDHEVVLDGVLFHISRYVFFRAGDRYFTLACVLRNRGNKAAAYHYIYGDEPWVGDFGTSAGDVGWTRDKIWYFEGDVDSASQSFAGMYDLGNPYVPGEQHTFSGYSNFIEWLGTNRPELVYFSNTIGTCRPEKAQIPLSSKDNRVLFLQWGPRQIGPGQTQLILLAVGMGDKVPGQQLPVKPQVHLEKEDIDLLREQ